MPDNKTIHLKIVTQNKVVFDKTSVQSFFTDAMDGRIGVMPNHIPLTSVLNIGVTKILIENEKEPVYVTTMGGILHFKNNEAVILTDIAELGQDIDEMRANEAYERAKARLEAHKDKMDVIKAQIALKKAIARISATRKRF